MTYVVNVSGHSDSVQTPEEARAFEEAHLAKAREFVASCEGVHSASFTGNHVSANLLAKEEENAESTEGS